MSLSEQIEKLSKISDGWLDGHGKKPEPWLLSSLSMGFLEVDTPFIYPTVEGGIVMEWDERALAVMPDGSALYSGKISVQGNPLELRTEQFGLKWPEDWRLVYLDLQT